MIEDTQAAGGALLCLNHLGQLLAQFCAILMSMHSDSVLHCRVYKLFLAIGRNCNGAVHFARVITAVHKQSGHRGLPRTMRLSVRLNLAVNYLISKKSGLVDFATSLSLRRRGTKRKRGPLLLAPIAASVVNLLGARVGPFAPSHGASPRF